MVARRATKFCTSKSTKLVLLVIVGLASNSLWTTIEPTVLLVILITAPIVRSTFKAPSVVLVRTTLEIRLTRFCKKSSTSLPAEVTPMFEDKLRRTFKPIGSVLLVAATWPVRSLNMLRLPVVAVLSATFAVIARSESKLTSLVLLFKVVSAIKGLVTLTSVSLEVDTKEAKAVSNLVALISTSLDRLSNVVLAIRLRIRLKAIPAVLEVMAVLA